MISSSVPRAMYVYCRSAQNLERFRGTVNLERFRGTVNLWRGSAGP